jgi:capsular exopolysaccharide synthesis family protein
LQSALKTDYKGPGLLEVKLSGDRPEELAPVVNAICRACIARLIEVEMEKRRSLINELERASDTRRKNLQQEVRALRTQEKNQGLEDWDTAKFKFQAMEGKLNVVGDKILLNGLEQNKLKLILASVDGKGKPNGSTGVLDKDVEEIVAKPHMAGPLLKNVEVEDIKIRQFELTLNEPYRSEFIAKSMDAKAEYLKKIKEIRKAVRMDLEKQAVAMATEMLETLKKDEGFLQGEKNKLEEESKRTNPWKRPENLISAAKRIEDEEAALKRMTEKISQLKMEPPPVSRLTFVQEAEEPAGKDYGRHIKLGGAGSIGVFFMLLFGVAWLESRERRINAAEEVSQGLGISLVGTLPNLPARARTANPTTQYDIQLQSQLTEAVDGIRTMLLHSARTDKLNVIMITSALGGEGKTSLATQLAASLARAWRKTLLVDGDLRNPASHKLFDLPLEPGFSDVLRGEVNVADTIKPTAVSRLWLMPAGQYDAHALQALAQDGVHTMFEQLKQQYDFIIVDSCPVLPVADALNLGQHVDGVVFAVLRDVSRSPAVYAAQQRLHNLGIRTLGAVVIGENTSANMSYPYSARSA